MTIRIMLVTNGFRDEIYECCEIMIEGTLMLKYEKSSTQLAL